MLFNDPVALEDFIAPVGGDVLIRPATGSVFNAEISMRKLEHVGLFAVSANSFKVVKEPQKEFYGLTVPLSAGFTVSESGRNQVFETPSAHLLSPGQSFDCMYKSECRFLVANFFVEPVNEYSQRLIQSNSQNLSSLKSNISFLTQAGSDLLRSVAMTWSALNKQMPASEIILKELEDDLLASFVLHQNEYADAEQSLKYDDQYHLSRAEEFICANLNNPITRDQLADVSGRSIRTLSRSFEKKHGIGPMAFIKQRRLDAAYLDLLSAKPDNTTVTQVAINYGFAHIGKFAIEYGKAFGETPSTSLAR